MWLIKASLRNPYMVLSFVVTIFVLGVISTWRIPVDILPVFKAPAVQVLTYYPGMSAASVEKTITNRLERWVNQAPGVRLVESRSVPGVSVVKVYFREDTDSNQALTLVNSLALGALPNLPPNTLPPVALPFDATGTLPVAILAVSNPFLDDSKQKDIARIDVRNMLGAVPGCIAPVVVGGRDRSVMVYLDPLRMQARNLVPTDVVAALRRGNLMVSPGTAYFGENQMLLNNNAMVETVAELNDMPITLGGATSIFLRDIGHAEDAAAIQTSRVRIDGRNEVFVPIYRQQGASSLSVVDELRKQIPSMEDRLPKGTKLELVMDQTIAVSKALGSLVVEGVIGALLVSLMILLFLGDWRMTVIATVSIPLSILGAIACLFVTGNTLNLITLSGLALAIGPLVDDAIVELENNHRNYLLGKSRIRAAIDGCGEVMVPVLVATCTTVIVLSPLALLPGIGGFLFRPLTLAVAFAMLFSFVLSRTFVPMMCGKFLPDDQHSGKASGRIGRGASVFQTWVDRLALVYSRKLDWCLKNPAKPLLGVGLLFAGSLLLLLGIGSEYFPRVDAGQITIRLRAPSNLKLDATEKRVGDFEEFLRARIPASERSMIVSEIGLNPDWSSAYTTNSGQQDAVIRVQLTPSRLKSAEQYASLLRAAFQAEASFADLRASFDTGGMISTALNQGASSPIDIEIEGGTTDQLLAAARKVRGLVAPIAGAADVRIQQRNDAPYLILDVDRVKAAQLGLSAEDIVLQVVIALNSSVSVNRNFWIDSQSGNQYFVGVQYPEDASRTMEDVLAMPVASATGGQAAVNLGSVVTLRRSNGEVEINHANLKRVTNVFVNTDGRDLASVARNIETVLQGQEWPEGLRVQMKGEYGRMKDSFRQLGLGIALSIGLVYLLQVVLFRSWIGPLVIMVSVPLGFIGVLWMLFLTRTTLNAQSLIGATFLIGIAVNNGVLLVEFANRRRKQAGLDAGAAIREAAATRFRPILMTFFATSLAMLPMAIGLGRGNEAAIPLARAVIGGLLSSTFLTLFLIPILYTKFMKKQPVVDAELERELKA